MKNETISISAFKLILIIWVYVCIHAGINDPVAYYYVSITNAEKENPSIVGREKLLIIS